MGGDFLSGFQGDLGDLGGSSSASSSASLTGGSGSIVIGSQKEWLNYLIIGLVVIGFALIMKVKK